MANLRRRAARQAHRAARPQRRAARQAIRGVRSDTAAEVGALNTMGRALSDSLDTARSNVRQAGLQGDDLQMILKDLALQERDVAAGTQLQISQTRQEGQEALADARSGLTDIADAEAAARLDILGQLQTQRADRREKRADRRADVADDLRGFILDNIDVPGAGGGSSGGGGGGDTGLTPTQAREKEAAKQNAAHWAIEMFRGAKADPEGPGDPKEWDESAWDNLTSLVLKQEGVSDVADARWAVARIRENVTGEQLQAAGPIRQNPGYHGELAVPGAQPQTPMSTPAPSGPLAALSTLAQKDALPGVNPDLLSRIVQSLGLR